MWTCGFLQSTSVTTPLNVCGFLSSNFAEMGWCAEMTVPSSNTVPSAEAIAAPDFVELMGSPVSLSSSKPLLPTDLQLSALALVLPGPNDRAVLKREVFDLAVEGVVEHSRLVLDIGLKVHDPAIGVECGVLDRGIVGSGIDHAADHLAVPVHNEHDVVGVRLGGSPRTQPRSLQWMALLRKCQGAGEAGREHGHGNDQRSH